MLKLSLFGMGGTDRLTSENTMVLSWYRPTLVYEVGYTIPWYTS